MMTKSEKAKAYMKHTVIRNKKHKFEKVGFSQGQYKYKKDNVRTLENNITQRKRNKRNESKT